MSERNDEHDSKGFRQIGSQMPAAARSPKIVAGEPNGSTLKLPTSGSTTSARGVCLPTSVPPGSDGLSGLATMSLVEALATREAGKVERSLMASLPSCVNTALSEHLAEGSYLGPYGFNPVTDSFEIERSVEPADLMAAIALVGETLKPAPSRVISDELARLRMATVSRDQAPSIEIMLDVYADELAEYPVDIVVDGCRSWSRREKFWPSVAELREQMDRLVLRRRRLRDALTGAARA